MRASTAIGTSSSSDESPDLRLKSNSGDSKAPRRSWQPPFSTAPPRMPQGRRQPGIFLEPSIRSFMKFCDVPMVESESHAQTAGWIPRRGRQAATSLLKTLVGNSASKHNGGRDSAAPKAHPTLGCTGQSRHPRHVEEVGWSTHDSSERTEEAAASPVVLAPLQEPLREPIAQHVAAGQGASFFCQIKTRKRRTVCSSAPFWAQRPLA